jgi:hypothetical protein
VRSKSLEMRFRVAEKAGRRRFNSAPGLHRSKELTRNIVANASPLLVRIHEGQRRFSSQLDRIEELRSVRFLGSPLSVRFALSRG